MVDSPQAGKILPSGRKAENVGEGGKFGKNAEEEELDAKKVRRMRTVQERRKM